MSHQNETRWTQCQAVILPRWWGLPQQILLVFWHQGSLQGGPEPRCKSPTAEIRRDQQIHAKDLESAESAAFGPRRRACGAFQLSAFSSSSGSHRLNEIFIVCHWADARRAGHSEPIPPHKDISCPALSPHMGRVVSAQDAGHSWPHRPTPAWCPLSSQSATALPGPQSDPQRGKAIGL